MDTIGSSNVEGRISAMLCPTSRTRVEPALPVITTASSPIACRVIWKFSVRVPAAVILIRRVDGENPIFVARIVTAARPAGRIR